MKTAGVALVWIGVVAFLKSLGIIQVVDWSIIWPVLLIIIGSSLKFCRPMMHGMYGKCGMSGKWAAGEKCGTGACGKREGACCVEFKK